MKQHHGQLPTGMKLLEKFQPGADPDTAAELIDAATGLTVELRGDVYFILMRITDDGEQLRHSNPSVTVSYKAKMVLVAMQGLIGSTDKWQASAGSLDRRVMSGFSDKLSDGTFKFGSVEPGDYIATIQKLKGLAAMVRAKKSEQ